MTDELLRKIREELQTPIESERQVVYLLVEVRKLLERESKLREYPLLVFACDWVVHAKLSGSSAHGIVKLFDKYQGNLETGTEVSQATYEKLSDYLNFETFRKPFKAFLEDFGLPIDLCEDDGSWRRFFRHYVAVISDCSLKIEQRAPPAAQNVYLPKYTDEVVVRLENTREGKADGSVKILVQWHWTSLVTKEPRHETSYFVIPAPPAEPPKP